MEPFVSNLRKRAEELGISHAEAARRIGMSERRYGNYVSGRREPDLATLVRIADVLGTTPDGLLTPASAPGGRAEPDADRLLSAFRTLAPNDRASLMVMIEALARHSAKRGRS